jgi:hypothetical protein
MDPRDWRLERLKAEKAQTRKYGVRAKMRKYGLTEDDYESLFERQHGLCAVCAVALARDKTTHIDHNHQTNRVRGLLCSSCNRAIGLLKDRPDVLRRAAEYLEFPTNRA